MVLFLFVLVINATNHSWSTPFGHMAYWFVLEDMVNCFGGSSWESLIPSPTQRRCEGGKRDNVLLGSLSSLAMYRNMCIAPHKFLAFVIAHCMCQIFPFDGAFCLHSNVPGPRPVPLAVLGKGFSEGLSWHGDVELSLLQNRGSFIPCWQQELVLPNSTG